MRDAESGAPVPDAAIYVKVCGVTDGRSGSGGGEDFTLAARSDTAGHFRIERLHPKRYQLDVDAPGFVRHVVQAVEDCRAVWTTEEKWDVLGWLSGGHWNRDWDSTFGTRAEVQALLPHLVENRATLLDVRLRRARAIEGTVYGTDGSPIAGATIRIESHRIESSKWGTWCS